MAGAFAMKSGKAHRPLKSFRGPRVQVGAGQGFEGLGFQFLGTGDLKMYIIGAWGGSSLRLWLRV